MILYKYYSFTAGIAALNSRRLGFREPAYFNDPFELSYLSSVDATQSELEQLAKMINGLKRSLVVLSLARTPHNPLMWAHYSENHSGFVIGYEVDDGFLTDDTLNIIPVNRGAVTYTGSFAHLQRRAG